ncbi:hypothetical protein IW262DRAFT_1460663 [Armillaria fumosa]|nr:hypothetical protein IW262DRAFT_1460663 [Armillaria fumosa]
MPMFDINIVLLHVPAVNFIFTMDNVLALLRIVKTYKAECTIMEIMGSYTSGAANILTFNFSPL